MYVIGTVASSRGRVVRATRPRDSYMYISTEFALLRTISLFVVVNPKEKGKEKALDPDVFLRGINVFQNH